MDQHQQQLVTCSISEHYNNKNMTTVVEINSLSIIEDDDDELDVLLDIDGDCVGVSQKYQKMIHQQKNTEVTESSHQRRSRQLRRRRRRGRKSSE